LLEQKLVNLLHPLEKNEQSMVKLDSIFKSLGVETENDVKLLAQYFINHRQYKELIKNKTYTQKFSATSKSERGVGPTGEEDDKFSISTRTVNTTSHNDGKIVPTDSIHLIEQNEVVSALKTFVTIHHKSEK
jgi:dynein regulatory complex protein 1